MAAYQGHAHASAGRLDAALRSLDRADEWASRVPDEAVSPWLGFPDQVFVARQRAIILASYGFTKALGLLDQLHASTPGVFQRYRVTVAVDRARIHAKTQQFDEAAAALGEALLFNRQARSVEKARQGLEVHRLLDPKSRSTRELEEVIQAAKAREIATAAPTDRSATS